MVGAVCKQSRDMQRPQAKHEQCTRPRASQILGCRREKQRVATGRQREEAWRGGRVVTPGRQRAVCSKAGVPLGYEPASAPLLRLGAAQGLLRTARRQGAADQGWWRRACGRVARQCMMRHHEGWVDGEAKTC